MHTNKIFYSWEKDLAVLMADRKEFTEVISVIADYFHYKESKTKRKEENKLKRLQSP